MTVGRAEAVRRVVALALRRSVAPGQIDEQDLGDVVIEAGDRARVGDVVLAAAAELDIDLDDVLGSDGWVAVELADGSIVDATEVFGELSICHGDRLVIVACERGRPPSAPAFLPPGPGVWCVELVTSGGETVVLGTGPTTVGRSADNGLVLDDPSVSRRHAVIVVADDVTVEDRGSTNGTAIDGRAVDESGVGGASALRVGSTVSFGDVDLEVRRIGVAPSTSAVGGVRGAGPPATVRRLSGERGTVRFNRPPHVVQRVEEVVRRVPEAPRPLSAPRLPWLSASVPVVLAAVMVVLALTGPGAGLGGSYVVLSAVFLLMSPVMMVAAHWETKRSTRATARRESAAFDAALATVRREVDAAVARELAIRVALHPGADEWWMRARRRAEGLWAGLAGIDGSVRVGSGHVVSCVRVEGDADPSVEWHPSAPVVARLAEVGSIAVVGSDDWSSGVARAVLLQLATAMPPGELRIELAGPARSDWDWLKWLPQSNPIGTRSDPSCLDIVVIDTTGQHEDDHRAWATAAERDRSMILWLGRSRSDAPGSCGLLVEEESVAATATVGGWWHDRATALVTTVDTGASTEGVIVDWVDASVADRWARDLAPLELVGSGAVGGVPARVDLVELLGEPELLHDPRSVIDRWEQRRRGLRAPIGRTATGDLSIDLRDDGPHGVIAGTTGAGKSELLQTLVVSLAATAPPDRVNFLLVDYKGGAAFGECRDLPHTVGLVTDLDDVLVRRVLVSLRAELRRRERLLADAGAKDLATLEMSGGAPPSLVIIVDEFASLTSDVPEFIDGMIDIARRGRSLGLHLILATQRPAGVVSDQLRANANLRIALRVANEAESFDVVGVPAAATIGRDTPGRAMAHLGHDDVVEFQAAFCGGHTPDPPARRHDHVRVERFVMRPPRGSDRTGSDGTGSDGTGVGAVEDASDLRRLVATIGEAAVQVGTGSPRRPWLDPLPAELTWDAVPPGVAGRTAAGLPALLGLLDDPERQEQRWVHHDLAAGATIVYGAGAAPARCVEAMVVSAVIGRSPSEVQVDVIDSEVGALASLAAFPQVGAVIEPGDADRAGRLLRQLRSLVGGSRRGPERILVVNDVVGFASLHESADGAAMLDVLGRLVADGAAVGVHVVIVADRRIGVPAQVSACAGRRIVMAMSTPDEHMALSVDASLLAGQPIGRAVVGGSAVQTLVLDGEHCSGRAERLAADERRRWAGLRAPAVGVLPNRVEVADLVPVGPGLPTGSAWSLLVGVADRDLAPVRVDLGDGNLLVAGPMRSGRTTALGTMAASIPSRIHGNADATTVRRLLVAPRATAWSRASLWDDVGVGQDAARVLDDVRAQARDGRAPMTVLFVDDATEFDDETDAALADIAVLSRDHDVRLVAAAESMLARTAYGGLMAQLRRERRALLLQPDVDLDGDLAGIRLGRRSRRPLPPGRGELVERGRADLVQVALASHALHGGRPPCSSA